MKRLAKYLLILLAVIVLMKLCIPKPELLGNVSFSKAVYDSENHLLRLTLSRDEKYRLFKPLSSISPLLIRSTLLHEDRHFRWHYGFNPVSLVRAAWQTYYVGDRRIGGSTITMQLARLTSGVSSKTISGKINQILRAMQIEFHYSKDEILEAYLNLVPYGGNVEGVGAASLIYFKKEARQLTLPEVLTLTVIPQSPYLRAVKKDDRTNIIKARNRLFERWIEENPHDAEERAIMTLPVRMHTPSELPFLAPHFVDAVISENRYRGDILSTLDLSLQRLLERQVRIYTESKRSIGVNNASAMLIDYRNMEVKAVVGSADFFNDRIEGQVNGTKAKRSPGSALKPFIYALGFDQGLIHPLTMLKDSPASFRGYNPENFDNDFAGPIKVRDALIRSRNIPAVQVASRLKNPTLYQFLRNADISQLKEASHYGLSLVLGSAEMTMEELVILYAMLANGGQLRPLKTLIDEKANNIIHLISSESAYLTLDILRYNPRPRQQFRSEWTLNHMPVAWKTGTSFAFRDAWSIGIFGPYVLAVWIGNFDGESNPYFIGRDVAAPLLFRIIDAIRSHSGNIVNFNKFSYTDLNILEVEVCSVSGKIPGDHCRHKVKTWFIPGISPIEKCDIHRKITIVAETGFRSCKNYSGKTITKIYEFWPSDLLNLFRQAGMPRTVPPPTDPGCGLDSVAYQGISPIIMSPQQQVTYNVRTSTDIPEEIPFIAITDADASEVYWFIDKKFVGTSKSNEPLYWKPVPGSYVIRVVDDHGRADSGNFVVAMVQ
jgi:penicillin-binding protein 1C